jgi:hypothetical protein
LFDSKSKHLMHFLLEFFPYVAKWYNQKDKEFGSVVLIIEPCKNQRLIL